MAVSIIEQIIPSTNANRPGGNYTKSYITIHETGNKDAGAGAKNHANWLSNGANGEIGYHYTVDDHEIYHHIPDNERPGTRETAAAAPGTCIPSGLSCA